jgi:CDP-glucose 4,6-dehydratase
MKDIYNNIYKGKKVLVTGHTGFKGAWLSLCLILGGAEVIGYSLTPHTQPNLFQILSLEKHLTSIVGDIRDKDKLEEVLKTYKPDYIFHLAAQALVRASYREPHSTFETNIMGTVNLFEAVRKTLSECVIVNVTSDKCYENNGYHCRYKETDAMGGYDPYSASKGAVEIVAASYRNSFFNPENYGISHKIAIACARAGNVIGGGDWAEDRLIPDIVRSFSKNEEIIIRNPHAVRPWQHVMECISGYMQLGAMLSENPKKYAEGWNFGSDGNDVRTVEQILLKSIEIWGGGSYNVVSEGVMKEAAYLSLDKQRQREF